MHLWILQRVEKTAHSVDFLFASFQTMRKHLKDFRPDEFDYIVVDESHHIYGDTFIDVVTYWKPQFLLGMTATPDRSDGQDIRKVFGTEVFCLPLEEALAQNLLTPVDYRMITDEIQLEGKITSGDRKLSINRLNRSISFPKGMTKSSASSRSTQRRLNSHRSFCSANQFRIATV